MLILEDVETGPTFNLHSSLKSIQRLADFLISAALFLLGVEQSQ